MNTTHGQNKRNTPISHRLLAIALPMAARRAVFVSSLAAFLRDINHPDKELEDKLTSLFSLAYSPSTLRFPMQLHSRIWTDLDNPLSKEIPTGVKIKEFCDQVIEHTPSYLRYATARAMRADVFKLLRQSIPAC